MPYLIVRSGVVIYDAPTHIMLPVEDPVRRLLELHNAPKLGGVKNKAKCELPPQAVLNKLETIGYRVVAMGFRKTNNSEYYHAYWTLHREPTEGSTRSSEPSTSQVVTSRNSVNGTTSDLQNPFPPSYENATAANKTGWVDFSGN